MVVLLFVAVRAVVVEREGAAIARPARLASRPFRVLAFVEQPVAQGLEVPAGLLHRADRASGDGLGIGGEVVVGDRDLDARQEGHCYHATRCTRGRDLPKYAERRGSLTESCAARPQAAEVA
jgi:hypothetical protein